MSASHIPESIHSLISSAKDLFEKSFENGTPNVFPLFISTAPGRVNLIGEHTDYTGGYVLPLAIGFSTVCYGRGAIVKKSLSSSRCRIVSTCDNTSMVDLTIDPSLKPLRVNKWANYILGVLLEYLSDLEEDETFQLDLAISGDVPLGSGLSSSASLEVATAVFLESMMQGNTKDVASNRNNKAHKIQRAIRCQRAENLFCNVPCGIMDQFVSSAGCQGKLLLIDCRSLDFKEISMGSDKSSRNNRVEDTVVLVVTNSNVKHDLGDSEYPVRVQQCKDATNVLAKFNSCILTLRDASMEDLYVASTAGSLKGVLLQRARHVISENKRAVDTADALERGDWHRVGELMNESHVSMKNDYHVSCTEIDILVELAQGFEGVFGSRLTGGGFGGCTVTLVKENACQGLMAHLKQQYKIKTGTDCVCFQTSPSDGARVIQL